MTKSIKYPSTPTSSNIGPSTRRSVYGFKREAEPHDPKSYTIPDDSFTIAELFTRMSTGRPMPGGIDKNPLFTESPTHADLDMEKIKHLDLTELAQVRQRVLNHVDALNLQRSELEKAELLRRQNDDKTTKKVENGEAQP